MLLDENCTWQDYSGPGHTREIMASVTLIFFILLLESGSNTTEPNAHFHKKTVKSDLILLSASRWSTRSQHNLMTNMQVNSFPDHQLVY